MQQPTVGRLAPSPTGALHLGNARTFLMAWLSIRQQAGTILLRIEDIDSPRVKPWAVQQTLEDLRWIGLDWDYGPEENAFSIPLIQTQRADRYREVLDQLVRDHKLYRCYCSRSEVTAAASAPHEGPLANTAENYASTDTNSPMDQTQPLEGTVYPGTCRRPENFGSLCHAESRPFAWRWWFDDGPLEWTDMLLGRQSAFPAKQLGDFVIGKGDGWPAYQLAVIVDDHDMGVNEVVRGCDLVPSTYRQIAVLDHLRWDRPRYIHLPLMVGQDGRRLAKRHGDTRLAWFREAGVSPELIVGFLAHSIGMIDKIESVQAAELIDVFDWKRVQTAATTFDLQQFIKDFIG